MGNPSYRNWGLTIREKLQSKNGSHRPHDGKNLNMFLKKSCLKKSFLLMMYMVNDDVTGKRSPMRRRKKLLHFSSNISEDQLYESMFENGWSITWNLPHFAAVRVGLLTSACQVNVCEFVCLHYLSVLIILFATISALVHKVHCYYFCLHRIKFWNKVTSFFLFQTEHICTSSHTRAGVGNWQPPPSVQVDILI